MERNVVWFALAYFPHPTEMIGHSHSGDSVCVYQQICLLNATFSIFLAHIKLISPTKGNENGYFTSISNEVERGHLMNVLLTHTHRMMALKRRTD